MTGSTVVVVSLISRSDLNGRRGIVQNFVSESGRYGVKVDGEQASIALKPGNLQPAPAIGSTVILVSLVSRSDLNGRRGIVHGFKCETTRFEVKVDGEEAILSLKPHNLREVVTSSSGARGGPTAAQERAVVKVVELAKANSWLALSAMAGDALRTARELREVKPHWAGVIYHGVGTCCQSLGQHAKAMELLEQALCIFKELGDRAGQWATFHGLGNCYRSVGRYAKAMELFEQSLSMAKELGDRAGQAKALHGLGNCYESLGQSAKAMELFEQVLSIFKELGDREGQAKTLHGLGNCYELLGQYVKATELFKQSLSIAKELGDRVGQGIALHGLGNCYRSLGQNPMAIELYEQALSIHKELGHRAKQGQTLNGLCNCYNSLGQYTKAMELSEQSLSIAKELGDRAGQAKALHGLGIHYNSIGQHEKAIELQGQALSIYKELCDREGQGIAYTNMGVALAQSGDGTAAARALARGLVAFQRVERDVGAHDDRRVSVFEEQQKTYSLLQSVLLGQGGQAAVVFCKLSLPEAGWALGVAAEGKGRALAYRLGGAGGGGDGDDGGDNSVDRPYEDMCGAWWAEVQRLARAEGAATRVLEYSFLFDEKLAIWVVSGATGELLCSKVVASTGLGGSRGRSIQEILTEARTSMNVRGRDGMNDSAPDAVACSSPSVPDAESAELPEELQSTDADAASAQRAPAKDDQGRKLETKSLVASQASRKRAAEIDREVKLLQELYAALIAPVEAALEGAEEVLIVPHKELFEVPWAALTDANGRYLIEQYVIRTAPSLRVARQAGDKTQASGHVVLVGNPLPTRLSSLQFAEKEVEAIEGILNNARLVVRSEHYFRSRRYPHATKANVKSSLEGAAWAHMALHGDLETDALVLADPSGSSAKDAVAAPRPATLANRQNEIQFLEKMKTLGPAVCAEINKQQGTNVWTPPETHWCLVDANDAIPLLAVSNKGIEDQLRASKKAAPKPVPKASDLSMHEVQGGEGAQGVRLAQGATVVLSACNTGRGEIKAEGVVGLARGFLLANASAAVVSLWSVDDGSTAALMRIKYKHLAHDRKLTVPQALRLAMLSLARPRHAPLAVPHKEARDSEACESLEASQQGRQAVRDSGQYLELGDFIRHDGDGARGSSGGGFGGVLPALQSWIEMFGEGTEGASRCAASSSAAAHAATHMHFCETEEERRQYWREFCKRDVTPTCVLDFAYADHGRGGLNLSPDDRLLERLYCFEDLEDDMHLLLGGRRRRVILKVHTLRKWRERGDKLIERASKVTAVKVMYAYWNGTMFEMDRQSELKILPVSEQLQDKWRDAYCQKRYGEIEWEWRKAGSMPPADPDTDTGQVQRVYDEVRAAIKLGEGMFYRGATATDKSMQCYHSGWKETHGVFQVCPLFLFKIE